MTAEQGSGSGPVAPFSWIRDGRLIEEELKAVDSLGAGQEASLQLPRGAARGSYLNPLSHQLLLELGDPRCQRLS